MSQGTQQIEVPCDPVATQLEMPTTLGVGARPKIPKWKTSSGTLIGQAGTKSSLHEQQLE